MMNKFKIGKGVHQKCPHCGAFSFEYVSRWRYFAILSFVGLLLMVVGVFILGPIGLLMSLILPSRYFCQNCKLSMKASEYEALQKENQPSSI
jgi:hypothetical protein